MGPTRTHLDPSRGQKWTKMAPSFYYYLRDERGEGRWREVVGNAALRRRRRRRRVGAAGAAAPVESPLGLELRLRNGDADLKGDIWKSKASSMEPNSS